MSPYWRKVSIDNPGKESCGFRKADQVPSENVRHGGSSQTEIVPGNVKIEDIVMPINPIRHVEVWSFEESNAARPRECFAIAK